MSIGSTSGSRIVTKRRGPIPSWAPRRYSQPMLIDQLSYLYSNLDRADQRPGVDAVERYQSPRRQLDEQVAKLDELTGGVDDSEDDAGDGSH